jgi:hypothetical protein
MPSFGQRMFPDWAVRPAPGALLPSAPSRYGGFHFYIQMRLREAEAGWWAGGGGRGGPSMLEVLHN